ncbi:MAG: MBL fold metallo-hydrolase [Methanosarcinales archaeon]
MGMEILRGLGITPRRLFSGRGVKPHLSLFFNDVDGIERIFGIDTTTFSKKMVEPDSYLITHAHSDHYGKYAMSSKLSVASEETAIALDLLHGREFKGTTFRVGESFLIGETEISTFHTGHTIGSSAYLWETECGVRILVTGDVKEYRVLPSCDLLVTEANYGDPSDLTCYFEENSKDFLEIAGGGEVVFGAYAFGKAQRAVKMLRNSGFEDPIGMSQKSLNLTRSLLKESGNLVGLSDDADVWIVPPHELSGIERSNRFVLTCRSDYHYYPAIHLSDHMDVRGLVAMVKHCQPEVTLLYHPRGDRPKKLADHLLSEELCTAIAAEEIPPTTLSKKIGR